MNVQFDFRNVACRLPRSHSRIEREDPHVIASNLRHQHFAPLPSTTTMAPTTTTTGCKNDADEQTPLLRARDDRGCSMSSSTSTLAVESTAASCNAEITDDGQGGRVVAAKPFPWRTVLSLLSLSVMQPLAFEMIFPFVSAYRTHDSFTISNVQRDRPNDSRERHNE